MKKIVLAILVLFSLVACTSSSPKKEVEAYLSRYNSLSDEVVSGIETTVLSENLSVDNQNLYRGVLKRQYQNLKYEVKDEKVNGDEAVVYVMISVYDLYKVDNEALTYMNENTQEFYDENSVFSNDKYFAYKLDLMNKTDEMVSYDIEFKLNKVDDKWIMEDPDRETLEKLNGLYKYEND